MAWLGKGSLKNHLGFAQKASKMVFLFLFDFLFQSFEKIRLEKFFYRHVQAVAKLFDRGDRDALVPTADDVVDRRLGHAAHGAELIDGNISFPA